ncbi:E1-E2 ATPase-domain-containing protein [Mycena galopus ATCC 62051]|nr:E1-E2 ATPase-domain-containing protein [Mycena galopus ATCC 62051]
MHALSSIVINLCDKFLRCRLGVQRPLRGIQPGARFAEMRAALSAVVETQKQHRWFRFESIPISHDGVESKVITCGMRATQKGNEDPGVPSRVKVLALFFSSSTTSSSPTPIHVLALHPQTHGMQALQARSTPASFLIIALPKNVVSIPNPKKRDNTPLEKVASIRPTGLRRRLGLFGLNKLEQEEQNLFLQFLSFMWPAVVGDGGCRAHRYCPVQQRGPYTQLAATFAFLHIFLCFAPALLLASFLPLFALFFSSSSYTHPNAHFLRTSSQDFVSIVLLLFIHSTIGFYEERGTGNAVKALMDSLAPKTKVKPSGSWSEIESAGFVLRDMISFKISNIVAVDCCLTEVTNVSIDQAALTGEIPPQSKSSGTSVFHESRGFTCKQGEAEDVVISTSANMFFGHAVVIPPDCLVLGWICHRIWKNDGMMGKQSRDQIKTNMI